MNGEWHLEDSSHEAEPGKDVSMLFSTSHGSAFVSSPQIETMKMLGVEEKGRREKRMIKRELKQFHVLYAL